MSGNKPSSKKATKIRPHDDHETKEATRKRPKRLHESPSSSDYVYRLLGRDVYCLILAYYWCLPYQNWVDEKLPSIRFVQEHYGAEVSEDVRQCFQRRQSRIRFTD